MSLYAREITNAHEMGNLMSDNAFQEIQKVELGCEDNRHLFLSSVWMECRKIMITNATENAEVGLEMTSQNLHGSSRSTKEI